MRTEDTLRTLTALIGACKQAELALECTDPRPEALLGQVKRTRNDARNHAWRLGVDAGVFVAAPPPITSIDQFTFFGQS
jgi:hypothetical protein